jgi:hypothetical protein
VKLASSLGSGAAERNSVERAYPALSHETRAAVDTNCAAFHLNRRPQTLRVWACFGTGPILPVRVNGRLAWPVSELQRVLRGAA